LPGHGRWRTVASSPSHTAGFGEAEVVEIVALTAQVLMTNFMNSVADTEIDGPIAGAAA
jgi:alkylhydroperoxidase family enzyme